MFVIVDGSGLLHTEYYANCPFTQKEYEGHEEQLNLLIEKDYKGRYVNAIGGFMRVIVSILEDFNPEYFAICFDKNRYTTFRRQLSPNYKGNRGPKPEPLVQQTANLKELLKNSNIPILESETYEADDYAGSLAKRFGDEIIRIYTTDRDYLQLVTPNVNLWLRKHNLLDIERLENTYPDAGMAPYMCFEVSEEVVRGEWGILPEQVPDWKAISGDTADNIPGVNGISDKTIIPLLAEYGNIENIYSELQQHNTPEGLEELKQQWKQQFGFHRNPIPYLISGYREAFCSKQLAKIETGLNVGKKENYKLNINWNSLIDGLNDYNQSIVGMRFKILQMKANPDIM